ncbi:MAG: DUF92 domain-containing protein [Myxococcales bacterium]|nr:DUF92 domain-containing protein [Myxococcales bacterium]
MPFSLHLFGDPLHAAAINLLLGLLFFQTKILTRGGLIACWMAGLPTYLAFGWPGFLILLVFFTAQDLAVRFTMREATRRKRSITDRKLTPKTFGGIFVPSILSGLAAVILLFSTNPTSQFLCQLAFMASLSTFLGDLISTEFGQVYGKRTFQLITLERVRVGTRGGVSVEGSIAGGVTVLFCTVMSYGLFQAGGFVIPLHELGVKEIIIVIFASVLANHIESVISGVMAQFQRKPNKMALSFIGIVIGVLLALFFTSLPEG